MTTRHTATARPRKILVASLGVAVANYAVVIGCAQSAPPPPQPPTSGNLMPPTDVPAQTEGAEAGAAEASPSSAQVAEGGTPVATNVKEAGIVAPIAPVPTRDLPPTSGNLMAPTQRPTAKPKAKPRAK